MKNCDTKAFSFIKQNCPISQTLKWNSVSRQPTNNKNKTQQMKKKQIQYHKIFQKWFHHVTKAIQMIESHNWWIENIQRLYTQWRHTHTHNTYTHIYIQYPHEQCVKRPDSNIKSLRKSHRMTQFNLVSPWPSAIQKKKQKKQTNKNKNNTQVWCMTPLMF